MRILSILSLVILSFLVTYKPSTSPQVVRAESNGQIYFVSKMGSNGDGLSWESAWNELNQIQWETIVAGDVIYIDGGASEMVYETELAIAASGTEEAPIQILTSSEEGHQGQVIFFGGRSEDLPYCGQEDYEDLPEGQMREYGIRTNDHDYIVIDGQRWRGIVIHGYRTSGLRIDPDSQNILAQYLEIYNNGEAEHDEDEGWSSSHAGVRLGGQDVTLRRMLIHDNGQDAIQSLSGENKIHNFRLEQSWLYNERRHPTVNESANFCTHTDGLQIFDGGDISGITFVESIIGPGFTQNVLLGQTPDDENWANVHDVLFQDVVFSKAADNNVVAYRDSDPSNWTLERVTIDCLETKSHCLRIQNSNHAVRDSIVINGLITFPDGLDSFSGNCMWNARGFEIGEDTDPMFANVSLDSVFSLDNYAVDPESDCEGSRMASAEQLLALE
jgi:hypothetical protein